MRADGRKSRGTDRLLCKSMQELGSLATRLHSFIHRSGSVGRDFFPTSCSYKSSISNRPTLFLPPFPLVAFFRPFLPRRGENFTHEGLLPIKSDRGGPRSFSDAADDRLHSEIRVAADKPFHSRKIELLRIGICAIRARQRARAKELSKLER